MEADFYDRRKKYEEVYGGFHPDYNEKMHLEDIASEGKTPESVERDGKRDGDISRERSRDFMLATSDYNAEGRKFTSYYDALKDFDDYADSTFGPRGTEIRYRAIRERAAQKRTQASTTTTPTTKTTTTTPTTKTKTTKTTNTTKTTKTTNGPTTTITTITTTITNF